MRTAAVLAAMVVPAGAWAQQQPAPQMPGMAAPVAQAAVTGCAQAQPQALQIIEAANQRLELARQTNSPAAMRTAVDDLQGALRQLRAQLGACAGLQTATGDPNAGHAMPGGQLMPNLAQAPAAAPGTAATPPGSPVPALGTADPHAGHVTPGAPTTQANAPRGAAPQVPAARTSAAAPDPHAGHVMPGAPVTATAAPKATSQAPAAAVTKTMPSSGQGMASMPGHNMAEMKPASATAAQPSATPPASATGMAGHAMTTAANPAAKLADLMCQPAVEPKTAPRATYNGKAYYFCSAADRDQFLKSPAKYLER